MTSDNETMEAATVRFLDHENTLIDIPTAAALVGQRPEAMASIFGYQPDRGTSFGQTPLNAIAVLIDQGHIQVFAQDPKSKFWLISPEGRVVLFIHGGQPFGVVQLPNNSIAVHAAVKAAQVVGAMEAAEHLSRQRRAEQEQRQERREEERQRIEALNEAHGAVAAANRAFSDHVVRVQQETQERQRLMAHARLTAQLRSHDPEARKALATASGEDAEARQAADQETKRLKAEVNAATERCRLAQIEDARRRGGIPSTALRGG